MRVRSIAVPVVVFAALLVGCDSGSDTTGVDVGLKEFAVTSDPVEVDAGETEFTADNIGTEVHEMVIVRAKSAADLPTDANGAVDEAPKPRPGRRRSKRRRRQEHNVMRHWRVRCAGSDAGTTASTCQSPETPLSS